MNGEKRRRALGADALDGLVPSEPVEPSPTRAVSANKTVSRSTEASASEKSGSRSKITFSLPDELLEECRNAVDYLSGPPTRLTLAAFVERALRRELASLKTKHNEGNAFPSRDGPLRTGRPMRG